MRARLVALVAPVELRAVAEAKRRALFVAATLLHQAAEGGPQHRGEHPEVPALHGIAEERAAVSEVLHAAREVAQERLHFRAPLRFLAV